MKEKKLKILGMELTARMDARRAAKLTRTPLWRYVGRPTLNLLSGNRTNGHRRAYHGYHGDPVTPKPPAPPPNLDDPQVRALWERVSQLRWYHAIDLGHGIVTPGMVDHRAYMHRLGLPADMTGLRCLDIGTFDGFIAFEMERRGAAEVVGLDIEALAEYDLPRRLRARYVEESKQLWGTQPVGAGFRLAHEILGSKVKRQILNVYDLAPDKTGMFDVVWISDVLVHTRDPMTVLENIFSVTRGYVLVASAFNPEFDQIERPVSEFIGTDLYWLWWGHSAKTLVKMMKLAGFDPVEELDRIETEFQPGRFWKIVLKGNAPRTAAPQA